MRERKVDARRPWHLWLVAIVVFALYVGGARDYLLIVLNDTDYMVRQFGPRGVVYFAEYPRLLRVVWTINILGGLIAPVLLLTRSRWSAPVAALSAAAQVMLLAVTFTFLDRWAALGPATSWFDIGVGLVTVLFAGYCWWVDAARREALPLVAPGDADLG